MTETAFNIDWIALWIALAFFTLFYLGRRWRQRFSAPMLKFSNLADLNKGPGGWRTTLHRLPRQCTYASLAGFLLAFVDPHFLIPKEGHSQPPPPEPQEGIGIYLVLDQSGSMAEKEDFVQANGAIKNMSKIDMLKQVTSQFVKERPNDLIGMIAFARGAYIRSPLTLDHQAIMDQLKQFDIMRIKDQDGTSIGYAIYKAATIIAATRHYAETLQGETKPAYDIKSNIIILVTDGVQETNDLDKGKRLRNLSIPEASSYAKELGVRLYIVNIEPRLAQKEFEPAMRQMQQAAEGTGGKFFLLQGTTSLVDIYAAIDKLEKSHLPSLGAYAYLPSEKRPAEYTVISLYPYLIAWGMLCILLALLLNTIVMRRAP